MKKILFTFAVAIACNSFISAQKTTLSNSEQLNVIRDTLYKYVRHNPTYVFKDSTDSIKAAYKGEMSGDFNGIGVYSWADGSFYFGNFSNGDRNGSGLYIVRDGMAVKDCPTSTFFVGFWKDNQKSGKGTGYNIDGKLVYYGTFSEDKPDNIYETKGFAAYRFDILESSKTGSKYLGETYNSEPHGVGIYIWADGKIWYGNWRKGKRAGKGILLNPNGGIMLGTWNGDDYKQ
ncbi:MAG: hypothetical protein LBN95_08790 [Prevotellaceae bacterium]|jgi:hypothetical protein|nr:hypothetical protein [Prevotellaceae bacterium]